MKVPPGFKASRIAENILEYFSLSTVSSCWLCPASVCRARVATMTSYGPPGITIFSLSIWWYNCYYHNNWIMEESHLCVKYRVQVKIIIHQLQFTFALLYSKTLHNYKRLVSDQFTEPVRTLLHNWHLTSWIGFLHLHCQCPATSCWIVEYVWQIKCWIFLPNRSQTWASPSGGNEWTSSWIITGTWGILLNIDFRNILNIWTPLLLTWRCYNHTSHCHCSILLFWPIQWTNLSL